MSRHWAKISPREEDALEDIETLGEERELFAAATNVNHHCKKEDRVSEKNEEETKQFNDIESNQTALQKEKNTEVVQLEHVIKYNKQDLSAPALMKRLMDQHELLMISKSTCPFCVEMRQMLQALGVRYSIFNIDEPLELLTMREIQDYLKETTGQRTVPNLIVKGKSIGGCMDLKKLEFEGKLLGKLAPFVTSHRAKQVESPIERTTIFYFPETANRHGIRVTAFITFAIAVFSCVYYESPSIKWVMLGLFLDFVLRAIFGPALSPIGLMSSTVVGRFRPAWTAGPPKQFAVFCGVFMTAIATGFWFKGVNIGGLLLAINICFAAVLEWMFDICLGCWVYGKMIQMKLINGNIYRAYLNLLEFRKWTYEYQYHMELDIKETPFEHIYLPGQTKDTPVDLIRKVRPDSDFKQQDHSFIRHCRVEFFSIPATLLVVALMMQIATEGTINAHNGEIVGQWHTRLLFWVLFYTGIVVLVLISTLYGLRWLLHPRKVWKEWFHPLMGNFFAAVVVSYNLVGLCIMHTKPAVGITIVWTTSVVQMVGTVLRISDLVYQRIPEEFHKPALMMTPVSLFLCSMGFAKYASFNSHSFVNYLHVARMFFGVATFFGLLLLTVSFRFALLEHYSDERLRFMLWIWLAACAAFGQCYLVVSGDPSVGTGVLFQSMYFICAILLAVLLMGWAKGFFSIVKDMSIWVMAFSTSVYAVFAMRYHYQVYDTASLFFAMIVYAIACWTTAVCALHTLSWLVDGSLFKPRYKWGPVQFMKFQHELFYHAIPIIGNMYKELLPNQLGAIDAFCHELRGLLFAFIQHGRFADDYMFAANRRFFPNMNPQMDEAHHYEHVLADEMLAAMKVYQENKCFETAREFLAVINRIYPHWGDHVIEHSRDEEATVLVSSRKYVPLETMTGLAAAAYKSTSNEEHAVVIPFSLKYLPVLDWKIRYVRCYIWGYPPCAQELGMCIYRNCDDVLWSLVSEKIPEIIPRGLPGYRRYY